MSCSKSIVVVAPGCRTGLIQGLLNDCVLPAEIVLLLPPISDYADAEVQETPSGRVWFRRSPAQRFFSTRHLKWLRGYLRSSEQVMVVIHRSPYEDLSSAGTSLLVMLLSGKTITVLRPMLEDPGDQPGSHINLNVKGVPEKWKFLELNGQFLVKNICSTFWSHCPVKIKNFINNIVRDLYYYFRIYEVEGNDVSPENLKPDALPVNLKPLDSTPEAVQRDVKYAIHNACVWLDLFPNGGEFLKGKRVLEIGPGINFGAMLVLACHGAQVMVADRFLTPWNPEYHPIFYKLLRDNLTKRWPGIDPSPLNTVISQGGYPPEIISLYSCSLEKITVPHESVDLVLSNSVFEHLYDVNLAFYHLSRITKPGGLGIHMVDFRDHRDLSRPLEYLLLSEKEFAREFEESLGQYGNRYRPHEMQEFLELAGFEVREFRDPDIFTDEEYLTEFLRRLRKTRKSRYRDCPVENLRVLTGRFITVKKPIAKG